MICKAPGCTKKAKPEVYGRQVCGYHRNYLKGKITEFGLKKQLALHTLPAGREIDLDSYEMNYLDVANGFTANHVLQGVMKRQCDVGKDYDGMTLEQAETLFSKGSLTDYEGDKAPRSSELIAFAKTVKNPVFGFRVHEDGPEINMVRFDFEPGFGDKLIDDYGYITLFDAEGLRHNARDWEYYDEIPAEGFELVAQEWV